MSDSTVPMIPDSVEIEGLPWSVRRAWPADRGRIAVEAEREGRIRSCFLDGNATTVLPAGEDPRLPGLARHLGEQAIAEVLNGAQAIAEGPNGAQINGGRPTRGQPNRLLSHRPGRRAVIRLATGNFVKCVRSGKARAVVDGTLRAEPFAAGFRMPEVIAADDSTVEFGPLTGVELHDPAPFGPAGWKRAWADVLEAWARAEAGDRSDEAQATGTHPDGRVPAGWMPVHTARDEVRVLHDWRDRARPLLPTLLDASQIAALDRGIAAVEDELITSAGLWGPLHRDLHDKQLMWDPRHGPGLLDVDTACMGEREVDLGNLRAHALWRRRQGIWSDFHAEAVVGAVAATASATGADPARIETYTRATLLRLVCVYAFRPRWRTRIGALADAAGA